MKNGTIDVDRPRRDEGRDVLRLPGLPVRREHDRAGQVSPCRGRRTPATTRPSTRSCSRSNLVSASGSRVASGPFFISAGTSRSPAPARSGGRWRASGCDRGLRRWRPWSSAGAGTGSSRPAGDPRRLDHRRRRLRRLAAGPDRRPPPRRRRGRGRAHARRPPDRRLGHEHVGRALRRLRGRGRPAVGVVRLPRLATARARS